MELLSATNVQFGTFPVIEIWKGSSLVWTKNIYWTGLGADNNWSTTANWFNSKSPVSFSSLQFAGTNRLSAYNDLAIDTPFNGILFASNSGSFQLSGNRFLLNTGRVTNQSSNSQTINNDIKLNSGANIFTTSAGNVTFNGLLSGIGSVVKTGSGTTKVSVARSIFTGSVTVSGGTLQFDNLTTNGGSDLAGPTPSIYNLNGSGATLNLFSSVGGGNRVGFSGKSITFSFIGNQTLGLTGNILANGSTFTTNGGAKNYIAGNPTPGSNYFNGQYTTFTYNVADGTDDVDLEVSAYMYNHAVVKNGNGKMSAVAPFSTGISGPLTISAGTFDIGGSCSIPINFSGGTPNTIANNGTFSYSSSVNSNCSNFAISGTGNLIKSGTSSLTLSSARCTYNGSTSITNGSIVTTKDSATATFTSTTLTVSFSTPPSIGNTFRFFPGTTVQTYASVSLLGAPGRTASYNSSNSTLTIDS